MKAHLKLMNATFALALAAGAMAAFTAAPAGAAVVSSCKKLGGTATFSPGIGATPKDQTIKSVGKETGCTPAKATGGSGTLNATIPSKAASCAKLVGGNQVLKGVAKSTWKNKKTTNFNITLKTGTGGNATLATITGTATKGLFKGKTISGQIRFTIKAGQNCTTVPVKNLNFTSTKPFAIK
jgi:hypothetical protein